jgi:hypothetical protein
VLNPDGRLVKVATIGHVLRTAEQLVQRIRHSVLHSFILLFLVNDEPPAEILLMLEAFASPMPRDARTK